MRLWTGFRFGHRQYAGVSFNRHNLAWVGLLVAVLMLVGVIARAVGYVP